MKDHEIGEAIRELNEIAIKYHGAQQMRSHIEGVVLRIRDSFLEKMQLTVKDDRKLRDDLIDVLRKNGFVYKEKFKNKEGSGDSVKFVSEAVISETDTFILSQLIRISDLDITSQEFFSALYAIEKNNVIFFQLMDYETKINFLEVRDCIFSECRFDCGGSYALTEYIMSFLKNCIKKAEEKAK